MTRRKYPTQFYKQLVLAFINCGLLCDYRINDKCEIEKCQSQLPKYFHVFWRLFHVIYYIVCIFSIRDDQVPKYYFDTIYLIGGNIIYLYLMMLIIQLTTLAIIIAFNFGDLNNRNYGLLLVKSLESFDWFKQFGVNNYRQFQKLRKRYIRIFTFQKYLVNQITLFMSCIALVVTLLAYDITDFVTYGPLSALNFYIYSKSVSPVLNYSLTAFLIVIDYCRIRFQILNYYLDCKFSKNLTIRMICEHNSVCNFIANLNKFWCKFFLSYLFISMPANLVMLHEALFGSKPTILVTILLTQGTFAIFIINFVMNAMTSSVNREANRSYLNLLRISRRNQLDLRYDIKVLIKMSIYYAIYFNDLNFLVN